MLMDPVFQLHRFLGIIGILGIIKITVITEITGMVVTIKETMEEMVGEIEVGIVGICCNEIGIIREIIEEMVREEIKQMIKEEEEMVEEVATR